MNKRMLTIALVILCVLATIAYVKMEDFFKPDTKTNVEHVMVPEDERASAVVPPNVLRAAADQLAAEAKDFGTDCTAAEAYYTATRKTARCNMNGFDGDVIYSDKTLPEDPN